MGVFKPNNVRKMYKGIYWCWKAMKQRCQNPKCQAYHNYGARGITVCGEWQEFEPFLEWCLANGYQKGLELDRINNDGNYEPSNCRWTTRKENSNNTRFTVRIDFGDRVESAKTIEERLNIPRGSVGYWRWKHGEEYAKKRIKEAEEGKYRFKNYAYSHGKRTAHESGKEFESAADAAKYYGLNKNQVATSARTGKPTSIGQFFYIEQQT